jgi:acyl-CoA thioester hydrolase
MTEPFRYRHRVTYAECTIGDHVYHSRYLDYLEAARGEFMRSLGGSVLSAQAAGYIFPVIEARLRYKYPARYDDLLTIRVWMTQVEGVRLGFGHQISNQDGKLILEAETFHCCTSREEKPKRLPADLAARLQPFLNCAPEKAGPSISVPPR